MINITTNLADDILLDSISRIDKTNSIINFNLKPKLLLLKEAVILWYDLDKQKATNENMSNNPVIKDFSGNNIYSTCNSFSWDGHSGVGSWPIPKCSITGKNAVLINNYKCIINNINFNGLKFPTIKKDNGEEITIRIKVTNVNTKYNLSFYYYNNITETVPVAIRNNLNDGVTTITINKSEFQDDESRQYYICYRNPGDDTSINTTVEILQDYDYNPPTINANDNRLKITRDGYKFSFFSTITASTNLLIGYGLFNGLPSNKPIRIKAYKHGLQVFFTERYGQNKKLLLSLQPYEEGEFIIDFDYTDDNRLMFSANIQVNIGETFTFEFLPTYDKYLLFDGIDDFSQSEYFKLSERFTILFDAIFINEDIDKTAGILKTTHFYLYNYTNGIFAFVNTGSDAELIPKNLVAVNPKYYYFKDGSKLRVGTNQKIPNSSTSVLRMGCNNSSDNRICTKIAIRKIIVFDRILNNKEIDIAIKYFLNPIDIESKIKDSLICHYDIAKQGATNETLSTNPVLKDLSNNGNDADLIGFDYKGMSGVGGYYFKEFHVDTDKTLNYESDDSLSYIKVLSPKKESNTLYTFIRSVAEGMDVHYKIRVTGLDALRTAHPNAFISNSQEGIYNLRADGEYECKKTIDAEDYIFVCLYINDLSTPFQPDEAINVTIEQLPLYPGALVSDGVDDYGHAGNKYSYDFSDKTLWRSYVAAEIHNGATETTVTMNKTSTAADWLYNGNTLNLKIRITGLKANIDAGKINSLNVYPNHDSAHTIFIHYDGDYDIAFTEEQGANSDAIYFVCSPKEAFGEDGFIHYDTPIIIEQLPTNKSLVLNKDDGYTVIAKRKRINNTNVHLITKAINADNYAGFIIGTDNVYNFGQYNKVDSSSDIIVQTSHKFNGKPINIGDAIDTDTLALFKSYAEDNGWGSYAFYSLMLFNRDLTDEEIEYVKTNLI